MLKLDKVEWATSAFAQNLNHIQVVRHLMAMHCLCPISNVLGMDPSTGELFEKHKNSALAWSRVFEWPWVVMGGQFAPDQQVLDAGGGHAILQHCLIQWFRCRITNADSDEKALLNARDVAQAYGLIDSWSMAHCNLTKMSFADNQFDRVVCVSVLEHDPNWRRILSELERVLKPGGIMMVTMDIRKEGPMTEEFFVDQDDADMLLAGYGAHLPEAQNVLAHWMKHGVKLACLCMRFVKE